MKKLLAKMLLVGLLVPILSCNQHQNVRHMLPVTTKSDSAAQLYFQSWESFHYKGYPGMFKLLDQAIEVDSNFFSAYAAKAINYIMLKDEEKFNEAAQGAVKCKGRLNKGEKITKEILEAKLSDFGTDVCDIAQKYVEEYPEIAEAYINLAFCYANRDKYDECADVCRQALDLDPYNPFVNLILGYNLIYAEKFEEAEKYLDKYQELLPDAPNPYDSKGDLYMNWGKYELAYKAYMKAHDLGWGDAKAKEAKAKLDEMTNEIEQ